MEYKKILGSNIFGEYFDSAKIEDIINSIYSELQDNTYEYGYLNIDVYTDIMKQGNEGVKLGMYVYYYEIIQRAYLTAVTGFLRFYNWINGVEYSLSSNNTIIFASSLRGLIESSCDLYDALENIPLNLAEHFKLIKSALNKELEKVCVVKDIEDQLIHFQYTSKKNKTNYSGVNKNIYNPKSAKDYISSTNLEHLDLYKCYSDLCEITHPAENSISIFINNKGNVLSINTGSSDEIKKFVSSYSKDLSELLERTFNLLIIFFKTINLFNIEKLTLKYLENINCTSIPMWKKILKLQ